MTVEAPITVTVPEGAFSSSTELELPKKKLCGRAFYESIGSPKYIVAPMVEQSELAWRLLSRAHMPPTSTACYTPMFHSRNFAISLPYRQQNFPTPASIDGRPGLDRPLFVQFCSNVPSDLLAAAKLAAPYCDAVDLNLGCPQGIAKKGRYGAFLQEEWGLIHDLINTLHRELPIPVTAKIRILETKERTLEYAKMVLSAGASILTVHGRRREQKGHNTGLADWSVIRYLRDNLPPETVLFANGNILWSEDVADCLAVTGADGIMSAEGNLCNPAGIFRFPEDNPWDSIFPRMDTIGRQYLNIIRTHILPNITPLNPNLNQKNSKPELTHDPNLTAIKAHCFKLFHALLPKHTRIRDMLAKSRAYPPGNSARKDPLEDYEAVLLEIEKVVREQLVLTPEEVDPQTGMWVGPDKPVVRGEGGKEGVEGILLPCGTKRRVVPYYRCQPYYRPLPEEAIANGALTLKDPKKKKENKGSAKSKSGKRNTAAAGEQDGNSESGKKVKLETEPEPEPGINPIEVLGIGKEASIPGDIGIIGKEEGREVMNGIEIPGSGEGKGGDVCG